MASFPCPSPSLPCPPPCSYYAYWERRLFAAVSAMVVSGLQAFQACMAACRPSRAPAGGATGGLLDQPEEVAEDGSGGQAGKPPLFRVSAGLRCSLARRQACCRRLHSRPWPEMLPMRRCRLLPCVPSLAECPSLPPPPQVALALLAPEVVVVPSTAEASKQLGRLLRNLVESAKPFVRWMDGTCLPAPEQ